jgi:hypothetical protein
VMRKETSLAARLMILLATALASAPMRYSNQLRGDRAAIESGPSSETPKSPAEIFETHLDDVKFVGERLDQALAKLASQAGVRIEVNWDAVVASAVSPATPVRLQMTDTNLRKALIAVLALAQVDQPLKASIDTDGIIRISTADKPAAELIVVRFYHIRPIMDAIIGFRLGLGPQARPTVLDAIDQLQTLVESFINPECWKDNGGAEGPIRVINDVMIVSATAATQEKVGTLLSNLEKELTNRN